jgi:hypothetical protein
MVQRMKAIQSAVRNFVPRPLEINPNNPMGIATCQIRTLSCPKYVTGIKKHTTGSSKHVTERRKLATGTWKHVTERRKLVTGTRKHVSGHYFFFGCPVLLGGTQKTFKQTKITLCRFLTIIVYI